jgi:hypothetical protein
MMVQVPRIVDWESGVNDLLDRDRSSAGFQSVNAHVSGHAGFRLRSDGFSWKTGFIPRGTMASNELPPSLS